jgi:hypothetical protein
MPGLEPEELTHRWLPASARFLGANERRASKTTTRSRTESREALGWLRCCLNMLHDASASLSPRFVLLPWKRSG